MLQDNSIYFGDCLEIMKEIDDKSIDMILCDLPYGSTRCSWDSILPLELIWKYYNRIIKDKGAIVLNSSQPFTTILISSNFNNFAFNWVWNKKFGANFVQAKRQPIRIHEDILIFTNDGSQPKYYPQMMDREIPIKKGGNKQSQAIPIAITQHSQNFGNNEKIYNQKCPVSIIEYDVRKGRGLHPTQKPVSLCEYLIKTYTNENDLVLDNCCGSGTTCVAAKNLNRRFIGIENNKEYFDIATERIKGNV